MLNKTTTFARHTSVSRPAEEISQAKQRRESLRQWRYSRQALAWTRIKTHVQSHSQAFRQPTRFWRYFENLGPREQVAIAHLWPIVIACEQHARGLPHNNVELIEHGSPPHALPTGEAVGWQMLYQSMASALTSRLQHDGVGAGNLYLQARPPGTQLRAFELLRTRTPLISFSHALANHTLLSSIPGHSHVTLVDIGIGRGQQICSLLRNPAAKQRFQSLHVIGVEPDSGNGGDSALESAATHILRVARECGIEASFAGIGKTGETLTVEDIASRRPQGIVMANSAFALHHLADDGQKSGRDHVLRTLHHAGAKSITLVEPDSNHNNDRLSQRFLFACRHYGTLAMCLSELLCRADSKLVWEQFYAPEVQNVIAYEGLTRTERHEESHVWANRLQRAAWTIQPLSPHERLPDVPDGFDLEQTDTMLSMVFRGVPLVSVLHARCAD